MYSCPACGADDVAGRASCVCGMDLGLLQRLDALGDAWFNRGLEALRAGAPGRALEWLSACCVARPTDAAARRAQARVWCRLQRWDEARDAASRAAEIDPTSPDLQVLREALEQATAPAAQPKQPTSPPATEAEPEPEPQPAAAPSGKRRGRAGRRRSRR